MAMVHRKSTLPDFPKFPLERASLVDDFVVLAIHLRQCVQDNALPGRTHVRQNTNSGRRMENWHSVAAAEVLDCQRTEVIGIFPDNEINTRDGGQCDGPTQFFCDLFQKWPADVRNVVLVREPVTQNSYFARNPISLISLVLVHQSFIGQRLKYSIDRRSRYFQFSSKLRCTHAIASVEQNEYIQTAA